MPIEPTQAELRQQFDNALSGNSRQSAIHIRNVIDGKEQPDPWLLEWIAEERKAVTPNINKILAEPAYKAYSARGANMGRPNQLQGEPERLYLQPVQFEDDCYDSGGAYWGMPSDLWCAFSGDDSENDEPVTVFVRADSYDDAKFKVEALLAEEGFTFHPYVEAELDEWDDEWDDDDDDE